MAVSDEEQAGLYEELIHWAKHTLFREVIHAGSSQPFAGTLASAVCKF